MSKTIANNQLRLEDLPSPDADWQTLGNFALTFNGYEVWDSFEKCAEVANSRQDSTLTELRTCLFFEQRRWRHFGDEPNVEAMEYVHSILEKIRVKVLAGEVE
jgi:hypothetical protein